MKGQRRRYPLTEWRRIEGERLHQGMSRYRAHREIASLYGVSRTTVYDWLTPERIDKERQYYRVLSRRRRLASSPSEELRRRHRDYNTRYQRAKRGLQDHLGQVLSSSQGTELGLDDIASLLDRRIEIAFSYSVIQRALEIYQHSPRGPPVTQVEPDRYKVLSHNR